MSALLTTVTSHLHAIFPSDTMDTFEDEFQPTRFNAILGNPDASIWDPPAAEKSLYVFLKEEEAPLFPSARERCGIFGTHPAMRKSTLLRMKKQ